MDTLSSLSILFLHDPLLVLPVAVGLPATLLLLHLPDDFRVPPLADLFYLLLFLFIASLVLLIIIVVIAAILLTFLLFLLLIVIVVLVVHI